MQSKYEHISHHLLLNSSSVWHTHIISHAADPSLLSELMHAALIMHSSHSSNAHIGGVGVTTNKNKQPTNLQVAVDVVTANWARIQLPQAVKEANCSLPLRRRRRIPRISGGHGVEEVPSTSPQLLPPLFSPFCPPLPRHYVWGYII